MIRRSRCVALFVAGSVLLAAGAASGQNAPPPAEPQGSGVEDLVRPEESQEAREEALGQQPEAPQFEASKQPESGAIDRSAEPHKATPGEFDDIIPAPPPDDESYLDQWAIPGICSGPYDWLRLNSGEWLRGEVYRMRRKTLEFHSKRMKRQFIKWKHVAEICLPYHTRIILEGGRRLTGPTRIIGDRVIVSTRNGRVEADRYQILAILSGDEREINRWGFTAQLGLDLHAGNTDQTSFNTGFSISREDQWTGMVFDYSGSFGTANDQENVNKHVILSYLDIEVSRRFYVPAVNAALTYDKFQNIALRATPTSGVGYRILDEADLEWSVEAGLGAQYTQYLSVQPGQRPEETDAVTRAGTRFRWEITGDLTWDLRHDTSFVMTNFGLTNLRTTTSLSYEITQILKLNVEFRHSFIVTPVADAGGTQPKSNDLQSIASFELEFR